jgi:hypothetical protein
MKDIKNISATRKHVYFYALLFLGTIAGHNLWISNQGPAPTAEVEQSMAQIKGNVDAAQRMIP